MNVRIMYILLLRRSARTSREFSHTPRLALPPLILAMDEKQPLFAAPTSTDASSAGPKPIWKENKDNKTFVSQQNRSSEG